MEFENYFSVIFEDNHLIIVNKKSGVLVQGDETGDVPLSEHVKNYLKEKYNKRPSTPSRIVSSTQVAVSRSRSD